jgi:hypothetical protein
VAVQIGGVVSNFATISTPDGNVCSTPSAGPIDLQDAANAAAITVGDISLANSTPPFPCGAGSVQGVLDFGNAGFERAHRAALGVLAALNGTGSGRDSFLRLPRASVPDRKWFV